MRVLQAIEIPPVQEIIELLIWKIVLQPYKWAGDDPILGFDCSGAVLEILQSVGLYPHGKDTTAQGLWDFFATNGTDVPDEYTPPLGTLVFFGASEHTITHIGICMGHELMFEMGGGTRMTTTIDAAAQQNAYGRIRPISHRRDLVGFKTPWRSARA